MLKDYEPVRQLARTFLSGNLGGWKHRALMKVHKDVLGEEEAGPDPDILSSMREVIEVIAEARDEEEAGLKLLELEGASFSRHLACWLGGNLAHVAYAEDAFRTLKEQPNVSLLLILKVAHGHFKRRVGEALLKALVSRVKRRS